ncbi:tRNA (N6-isopentenyl adenosine(37)-C2)-methylthiotransferase MiaB [Geobacter argillaceus]|uniref:tRNA-2-methylthio-N(6)-dimethylallyladenosine synthase n=1 Tax=Geobacter argillaceus TaxID=345631 RepID=A0A562W8S3_9BACT|nr:tRNA (N6-isopentenyl adenosine(37)-C2)-methylthiotransferase MiaB [Geobacter argillaceus]TWJ26401.1 tRNA-i(6)A37 thiotransferase enzyme MiaB [Geobacter argillaceus]
MNQLKQLYLETFGCQMNVEESGKIAAQLAEIGYAQTGNADSADLVILNTCSVRARAEEKVIQHLENYSGRKRRQPGFILGVGGCVAQQEGERLLKRLRHLDFVFGTHSIHLVRQMVRAAEQGRRTAEVDFLDTETRLNLFPTDSSSGGVTRFVTIMQGCDNFCSYCIVPHVRGREISRRSGDILDEIRRLADNGVREVTLLGQNVNSYGLKSPDEMDFAGLLRAVAAISGIERIRFTTSHPKDLSPALVDCFADMDKLCSHFHLPAQSGSDRILNLMNRGYTRQEYLAMVAALKTARPDIQITGDIIVGFPGETDADFKETLSLMDEVEFSDLFSFIYSVRPETAAATLADNTSRKEKLARLDQLQSKQREMSMARNRSFVGSRQLLLVEGPSKREGQCYGRTSGNRVVNFPGTPDLVGQLVEVTVVTAYQNSLLGELVVPGIQAA